MLTFILIFVATFSIAAAVNMQSRNAILGHYLALFLTSIFIGGVNLFILKTIPSIHNVWHGVAYVLGGALGAVLGVYAHKTIYNKRK